jgi:hypothetical protein
LYVYIFFPRAQARTLGAKHDMTGKLLRQRRSNRECQKRPTIVSKETYYSVKRDLLQCQEKQRRSNREGFEYRARAHTYMHTHICIYVKTCVRAFAFLC